MDEQENAYLKQQIRDLNRARRFWKSIALSLLAAGTVFLVLGIGSMTMCGILWTSSAVKAERAAQAEHAARMEAQMQAERARAAEMAAKAQGEKLEKARGQKGK